MKKTSDHAGHITICGLYRTRTCNLLDVNEALCQLS